MTCPTCGGASIIIATRGTHRTRMCLDCLARWDTVELSDAELARLTNASVHAEARYHAARIWALAGGRP